MARGRPTRMLGIRALHTGFACTLLVLGKRLMGFSHTNTHNKMDVCVYCVCVHCVFAMYKCIS